MRCRDAKQKLAAQRDGDLAESELPALQAHLQSCQQCQEYEKNLGNIDVLLTTHAPRTRRMLSTERIMVAVQEQKRISQQLEDLRSQQRFRVEQMRSAGMALAAITCFTIVSLPLLFLALTISQTDFMVEALIPLNGLLDVLFISAQYVQEGLLLVTRESWLLSALSFAMVVMMGLWLRLMRYPQDA